MGALWRSGIIILLLSMGIAFLGYVLPYGQMSYWRATVIINLLSILSSTLVVCLCYIAMYSKQDFRCASLSCCSSCTYYFSCRLFFNRYCLFCSFSFDLQFVDCGRRDGYCQALLFDVTVFKLNVFLLGDYLILGCII